MRRCSSRALALVRQTFSTPQPPSRTMAPTTSSQGRVETRKSPLSSASSTKIEKLSMRERRARTCMSVFISFGGRTRINLFFLLSSSEERKRIEADNPPQTRFKSIPHDVPMDWFDPDYFNTKLTMHERHDIVKKTGRYVGLPRADLCTREHWGKWRNKKRGEFMEKFGGEELAKYDIPTDEDIAMLDDYQQRGLVWDEAEEAAGPSGEGAEDIQMEGN